MLVPTSLTKGLPTVVVVVAVSPQILTPIVVVDDLVLIQTEEGGMEDKIFSSNRPVCQVCQKAGHVALQCYHHFDNSNTVESTPPMQALLATPQQVPDPNWYPDTVPLIMLHMILPI
jgi:hypothetical protein